MPEKLKPCDRCKWNYPEEYLVPMTLGSQYTPPICGVCALELTNEYHGIRLTRFSGELAEEKRLIALEWRATHKGDAP